jgi:hypothetical protein
MPGNVSIAPEAAIPPSTTRRGIDRNDVVIGPFLQFCFDPTF